MQSLKWRPSVSPFSDIWNRMLPPCSTSHGSTGESSKDCVLRGTAQLHHCVLHEATRLHVANGRILLLQLLRCPPSANRFLEAMMAGSMSFPIAKGSSTHFQNHTARDVLVSVFFSLRCTSLIHPKLSDCLLLNFHLVNKECDGWPFSSCLRFDFWWCGDGFVLCPRF